MIKTLLKHLKQGIGNVPIIGVTKKDKIMEQDFNLVRVYIATELYAKYLMASHPDSDRIVIAKTAIKDTDCLINELLK